MDDKHVIKSGHLDAGGGHKIYFEEWGNKKAPVIFYLHGGPGTGFSDSNKLLFDPGIHHVVFHDQRGAGKSTPFAGTENNTTQDLISDIEKLRNHFGLDAMFVMGGSWGSALSLLYAIAHPKRVKRLLIWSVYLIRKFENDWINEGGARNTFPEAWERFIKLVPEKHRGSGTEIMKFFAGKIRSSDEKEAKRYADEWTLWEYSSCSITYNQRAVEKEILSENNTAIANLETHYFLHNCFVPENHIPDNIGKIKHIPCYVVQGRFDLCTPPITAYDLKKAYGKNLTLQWTRAGHLRSDPENTVAIRAVVNSLFR
jgi:proline iminopeptidase